MVSGMIDIMIDMRALLDDEIRVHNGQCHVSGPDDEPPRLRASFAGQPAGLCGAALPGVLYLITGLRTGEVGFRVELHSAMPPMDDAWEEIVEVSFRPSVGVRLLERPLPLPVAHYRVRYCATGMDLGRARDTRPAGTPQLDRYLLQFWPGAPETARVVKQTSEIAAYWHGWARELPLRLPDPGLSRLDSELAEQIVAAGPEKQRKIARWAARRAYAVAGIAEPDRVSPTPAALDRDEALPPPFNTADRLTWTRLRRDPGVVITDGFRQQAVAFPALLAATQDDPLRAALETVYAAAVAHGRDGYRALLDDAHWEFFA